MLPYRFVNGMKKIFIIGHSSNELKLADFKWFESEEVKNQWEEALKEELLIMNVTYTFYNIAIYVEKDATNQIIDEAVEHFMASTFQPEPSSFLDLPYETSKKAYVVGHSGKEINLSDFQGYEIKDDALKYIEMAKHQLRATTATIYFIEVYVNASDDWSAIMKYAKHFVKGTFNVTPSKEITTEEIFDEANQRFGTTMQKLSDVDYGEKLIELIEANCAAKYTGFDRQYLMPYPVQIGIIDGHDCYCVGFREGSITVAFNQQEQDSVKYFEVIEFLEDDDISKLSCLISRVIDMEPTDVRVSVYINKHYKELIYKAASEKVAQDSMKAYTECMKQMRSILDACIEHDLELTLDETRFIHNTTLIRENRIMSFRRLLAVKNVETYKYMTEQAFKEKRESAKRGFEKMRGVAAKKGSISSLKGKVSKMDNEEIDKQMQSLRKEWDRE